MQLAEIYARTPAWPLKIAWLSSTTRILGETCNTRPGSSVFTDKCFYTARGITGNTAIPMQTNEM